MSKRNFGFPLVFFGVGLLLLSGLVNSGSLGNAKLNSEIFATPSDDPYTLAVQAYVWGYPLVRAAQIRMITTLPDTPKIDRAPDVPGGPLNHIGHQRMLSTPNTRLGVAPNHDTLYSIAWLDLEVEPFVLEAPNFGDRYYVFQMGQADSSTDESIGQRSHGPQLPPVFIYSDTYKGNVPPGMLGVKSHYRYLMIAGRIYVGGESEIPVVHSLQDQIKLQSYSAYMGEGNADGSLPNQQALIQNLGTEVEEYAFLYQLGTVLQYWRPVPNEKKLVESFRGIGLTLENGFIPGKLNEADKKAVSEGLADAKSIVRSKTFRLGHEANGWSINYTGPRFESDYLLRAAVAMDQIYILEPEEALYPSARVDSNGEILDGNNSYRIYFAKDELPPVDAFWSVTLYYAEGFMVPNEINRWSINDKSADLVYGEDGSLEILIQHEKPDDYLTTNWLPAPEEPFMLLMRLYLPREKVLEKVWLPPPVNRLESP